MCRHMTSYDVICRHMTSYDVRCPGRVFRVVRLVSPWPLDVFPKQPKFEKLTRNNNITADITIANIWAWGVLGDTKGQYSLVQSEDPRFNASTLRDAVRFDYRTRRLMTSNDWEWLLLADSDWWQLMMTDDDRWWLMMTDDDWGWLIMTDGD